MAVMTDVERLATPHHHELYPWRRGPSVSLEVSELAHMMSFNRTFMPAEFTFLMEQTLNAFIAFNARSIVWDGFPRNGKICANNWKSPKASDEWSLTFACDSRTPKHFLFSAGWRIHLCFKTPEDMRDGRVMFVGQCVKEQNFPSQT